MTRSHIGLLAASVIGGVLVAGPAMAMNAFSTSHLNLRAGPGPQYPVVAVMQANVRTKLIGCLADYSWCTLTVDGLNGWASAEYLVVDQGGQIANIAESGEQLGVEVVAAEGFVAVAAGPTVGVITAPGAMVEAFAPPEELVTYITKHNVESVLVQGEVVVGASLSAEVPLYAIPQSPYAFAIINGQRVIVEPNARTVVYIQR